MDRGGADLALRASAVGTDTPTSLKPQPYVMETEGAAEGESSSEEYAPHQGKHAVRTLTLREYASEIVPLTTDQAGALSRAGGGKCLAVGPDERSGHWQVVANHHVGSINVGGLQVLVRPKIPLRNLFLLLEVGLREQDWHDEAVRFETTGDLLPALVSFFARTTETTLARGLYHSYREQRDRLVALRGRVDIARQLVQPGLVIPTACQFTEFTADLIEKLVPEGRRLALPARRRGAAHRPPPADAAPRHPQKTLAIFGTTTPTATRSHSPASTSTTSRLCGWLGSCWQT